MQTNKVIEIQTIEEFNKYINTPNKLFVIDFNADWCGPCQRIKPDFHELAHNNINIGFLSINVDKVSEVSDYLEISMLPTFVYIKDNKVLGKVIGADIDNVSKQLEQLKF